MTPIRAPNLAAGSVTCKRRCEGAQGAGKSQRKAAPPFLQKSAQGVTTHRNVNFRGRPPAIPRLKIKDKAIVPSARIFLTLMTLIEQIQQRSEELIRFRSLLDEAFAKGARNSSQPEDRIVFPLLVAARDVMEEILFQISNGHGRAALRSVRTLYECVVTAHHLHLHPEKMNGYFAMFYVQWAKILQNIQSQTMTDMHKTISQYVPKFAQGKMVGLKDLDWSGQHIREMAVEAGEIANLHPLAFDHASAYVHPSILFFLSTLTPDAGTGLLQVSVKPQDEEGSLALRASHDLLLNAVALRLKYVASDPVTRQLDQCKQDFISIWGYPPHI